MLRMLSLIAAVSLLAGCMAHKKSRYEYVQHINPQQAGERFIDSLTKQKIDTIVGYFYWTQLGPSPFYIYWESNGIQYISQINRFSTFKTIKSWPLSHDLFDSTMLRKLMTDVHVAKPMLTKEGKEIFVADECSDCPREQLYIRCGTLSKTFIVSPSADTWSPRRLFADKFRSILSQVQDYWQGENYKKEKIKMRNGYQIWN